MNFAIKNEWSDLASEWPNWMCKCSFVPCDDKTVICNGVYNQQNPIVVVCESDGREQKIMDTLRNQCIFATKVCTARCANTIQVVNCNKKKNKTTILNLVEL